MKGIKRFTLDRRRLKKLRAVLQQINDLADAMRELPDEALQQKTQEFKERLHRGASLDDLLPEAYAVVREVDYRILGLFPYDVQVLGAIVLHQGNVAEMKTGEGKTLTATMPLYLNALTGKGAMLVTTNDYLAKRDAEALGPVYEFLGLSVSVGVTDDKDALSPAEKRALYAADIHYTTNAILGFDYLIHHLASSEEARFFPELHYVIVDEADAVLLDTAQTPLVISGSPRVQSNLYGLADEFIKGLSLGEAYYFDRERKEVWFTQKGLDEMERYLDVENIFSRQNAPLLRHMHLALKAHLLMSNDKDYLIEDGEVKLLDQTNGRVLEGTRLQGGFHQALEEKEKVEKTDEMRAMASITYQNLFLQFPKLAGMTGTAKSVEAELIETYQMEVVQIPTHLPIRRVDLPDKIYTTLPEKLAASLDFIKELNTKGQPILVVTGSVRMSELYSSLLLMEGIAHNVLNAFHAAKEAEMIAEAGRVGNVTVATNMAGRGTDIKLDDRARELGGLAVICTERMPNQRMDLQAKGRAGRQGDPGLSQCFVSLEDDVVVEHGGSWVMQYLKRHREKRSMNQPTILIQGKFHRLVKHAQEASESQARSMRQMTLQFDASVKVQRELVYREREKILKSEMDEAFVMSLVQRAIADFVGDYSRLDAYRLERFIFDEMSYQFKGNIPAFRNAKNAQAFLWDIAQNELERKKQLLRQSSDVASVMRISLLKAIDEAWVEEVDYLQQLRILVAGRQSAQRNVLYEYHKEAEASFQLMKHDIYILFLRYLLLSEVSYTPEGELEIYFV